MMDKSALDRIFPGFAPGVEQQRESVTLAELERLGVDMDRDFAGSTPDDFKRYPVLSEGGWFIVVKHMPTLTSVSRERWTSLGPIALTSAGLIID